MDCMSVKSCKSDEIKIKGKVFPAQNYSCACVYHGNKFYVIGGTLILNNSTNVTSQCFEYDVIENHWTRMQDLPVPIGGATACMYGDDKILLVGGAGVTVSSYFHDIYCYTISQRKWLKLDISPMNHLLHFKIVKPIAVVVNHKMIIFCCTYENDGDIFYRITDREPVFVFDLRTNKLVCEHQKRGKYFLHSNTEKVGFCVHEHHIYVYGGLIQSKSNIQRRIRHGIKPEKTLLDRELRRFDTTENVWERVRFHGPAPKNFLSIHMFCRGDHLVCVGGMRYSHEIGQYHINPRFSSINIFNVRSRCWRFFLVEKPYFNRVGESCAMINDRIFSYGGLTFGIDGIWRHNSSVNNFQMFTVDISEHIPLFMARNDQKERTSYLMEKLFDERWREIVVSISIQCDDLRRRVFKDIRICKVFFV